MDKKSPEKKNLGGDASARQQLIGPSGGPPNDEEREWRGSMPDEDVFERLMNQGDEDTPVSRPPADAAKDQG